MQALQAGYDAVFLLPYMEELVTGKQRWSPFFHMADTVQIEKNRYKTASGSAIGYWIHFYGHGSSLRSFDLETKHHRFIRRILREPNRLLRHQIDTLLLEFFNRNLIDKNGNHRMERPFD